ncbi:MAG: ABC transporter ATP-binding protein [Inquilinus limosus]|uniref:ABC transporter ATP-binding protein n=1 Tax=Inquilinus limosus TaxID=171674 RepID=A0A952KBZ2_9PROT|nr:ABC transporter ATP-binding protein [Inquilinus limosus]
MMINRTMLSLAGPVGGEVALGAGLGLAVTAANLGQGVLLALVAGGLLQGRGLAPVLPWILLLAGLVLLRAGLVWLAELAAQRAAQKTKLALRRRLFERLLQLGPGFVTERRTGEIQATLVGGVEAVEAYVARYLPSVIVAVLGPLAVLGCLAVLDLASAAILAVFVVLAPLVNSLWLAWRMPRSTGIFVAMAVFGAFLLDSIQGLVTLKAFNAVGRRRQELSAHAARLRRESMRELSVTLMRDGVTTLCSLGGVAAVLAWGAWRVSLGELESAGLLLALFLAREAFRPIERMDQALHAAWAGIGAGQEIAALLAAQPAVVDAPRLPTPAPLAASIAFDRVGFAYDGAEGPTLDDVSLRVEEGEMVALVGPSGAGKSTVVALLLRFFDPARGAIRVGGIDIRDLPLASLRERIAVVSQDTHLFLGTVADNLRIARPEAGLDELVDAARAANAHDFIQALPEGYDTEVGERGALLSGGQRQRIAIARALLKDAPILVLDEATSSVDAASERAIQDALERLFRNRTTLVIAHRLSTIRKADRILVLDGGRVVEEGRHEALLADGRRYARLAQAQGAVA